MIWSVRLTLPDKQPSETGGTGMPGKEFAIGVYERLVDVVDERGGAVELISDGEVVLSYTKEAGTGG